MAKLSSQLVLTLRDRVSGPARGVSGALRRMRGDVGRFNTSQAAMIGTAGRSVRNLALLAGGYIGVTAGVGGALKSAMSFETAMADVAKKTTLTDTQLGAMGKTITSLSNSMPLARTEIAALIAQAGQFGIANDELERFALLGAKASVAFDMDTAQTAESLSKLKNAYGLNIDGLSGLADAINHTADSAGTSEAKVIDFLLRTGATARTFGIEAQEMAAFGATLNEIGIESSKAATGMNAMMTKISSLSRNKKAVKALDIVGGKGYSASLQKKFYDKPVEAMKELFTMSAKMSAEQRSGFFLDFFGLEYGDDAAAIANNIETVTGRLDDLADSTRYAGSVQKTYDIFAKTSAQRLKVLGNNLSNLAAAAGDKVLPSLIALTDKLVNTLGTLDQRVTIFDKLGAGFSGFFDGLGVDLGRTSAIFESAWSGIFGSLETFEEDTQALSRLTEYMSGWGETIGGFAEGLGKAAAAIERFIGADPGSAAELLKTIGVNGLAIAGVGAILGAAAVGILSLSRALFVLSGASMLLGGVKGITRIFAAIAGGAALSAFPSLDGGGAKGKASTKPKKLPSWGKVIGAAALPIGGGYLMNRAGQMPEDVQKQISDYERNKLQNWPAPPPKRSEYPKAHPMYQPSADSLKGSTSGADKLGEAIDGATESGRGLNSELELLRSGSVAIQINSGQLDTALTKARRLSEIMRANNLGTVTASGPKLDGARAGGGPVLPGRSYMAGEDGPEVITPTRSGFVHTAAQTRKMFRAMADTSVMDRVSSGARRTADAVGRQISVAFGDININGGAGITPEDISTILAREITSALRTQLADTI